MQALCPLEFNLRMFLGTTGRIQKENIKERNAKGRGARLKELDHYIIWKI